MDERILSPTPTNPPTGELDARRESRKQLLWSGVLQTAHGPCPCLVVDLSRGGAKLSLAAPVKIGQFVTLVVTGLGAYRGTVIWNEHATIGIRFEDDRSTSHS